MTAITMHLAPSELVEAVPQRPERLFSIKEAAAAMGLKYWLLLKAVNEGTIPSYRFANQRRRVRLSDIEAVLQANRT